MAEKSEKRRQTFAKTCHLKDDPEAIAFYEREHQKVWPEVLRALQAVGVLEMKIWRMGNRLFMYGECTEEFDASRDWARYEQFEKIAEWEALMQTVQLPPPEQAHQSGFWFEMNEIFSFSQQLKELPQQ